MYIKLKVKRNSNCVLRLFAVTETLLFYPLSALPRLLLSQNMRLLSKLFI